MFMEKLNDPLHPELSMSDVHQSQDHVDIVHVLEPYVRLLRQEGNVPTTMLPRKSTNVRCVFWSTSFPVKT